MSDISLKARYSFPLPNPASGLANIAAGLGALARPIGIGLIVPLSVLLVWSIAVHQQWLAPQILPAPALVATTTFELVATGQLQEELLVSLGRVLYGLALGGGLGLAFGLFFGLSRHADVYIAPTIRAFCLVPSLAWLPFLMLLFGIGETLKIVLIAKVCLLTLMIAAYEGIRFRSRKYDEVAAVLELPLWTRITRIVWPSVLPSILTGTRLAVSKAWKALILVEMISSAAGIGYLMMWGRKAFQLDVVFATIIVIGLVGWLMDSLLLRGQQRLTAWSFRSAN